MRQERERAEATAVSYEGLSVAEIEARVQEIRERRKVKRRQRRRAHCDRVLRAIQMAVCPAGRHSRFDMPAPLL